MLLFHFHAPLLFNQFPDLLKVIGKSDKYLITNNDRRYNLLSCQTSYFFRIFRVLCAIILRIRYLLLLEVTLGMMAVAASGYGIDFNDSVISITPYAKII